MFCAGAGDADKWQGELAAVTRGAARAVAIDLPEVYDGDDEDVLRKVHVALCDVHVIEGCLVCPKSGRRFPINNGIPNLLLHEDEL